MPALFFEMIYLLADTSNQNVYLTLDEARQYYTTAFTHYLFILTRKENATDGLDLAQVPVIVEDNQRYTQLTVTTATLLSTGEYVYRVYGQNSSSNLNPDDASVVGILEFGTATIKDNTPTFVSVTQNIIDDYRAGQES